MMFDSFCIVVPLARHKTYFNRCLTGVCGCYTICLSDGWGIMKMAACPCLRPRPCSTNLVDGDAGWNP